MNKEQLQLYLQEKTALVNRTLENLLPEKNDLLEAQLYRAMRHSLFAGGKRLRPILFLATLNALQKEATPYLPFAAALEMIHTYSLIHDDLPAMDDDDFRRGKPTCHKIYGEGQAILAGDGLLTYAFQTMLSLSEDDIAASALLQAGREIASYAGLDGMIAGQVVDIAYAGKEIDLPVLQYIHWHKTGALFMASIRSAAILAGASEKQLAAFTEYAKQAGLAFQIADDILDTTSNMAILGKPTGSDSKNNKITYPVLLGMEQAKKAGDEAVAAAVAALQEFGMAADILRALAHYFMERTY